jgi:hypothetical protein
MRKNVIHMFLCLALLAAGTLYGQDAPPGTHVRAAYLHPNPSPVRPDARLSYDPLAGRHLYRTPPGGIKQWLNPSGTDYGHEMDEWHKDVFLVTVRSVEFWAAVIFGGSFLLLLFEYIYRRIRMRNMREAFAGAALLFLNERTYILRRASDAIKRHNDLVGKLDQLKRELQFRAQLEEENQVRNAIDKTPLLPGEDRQTESGTEEETDKSLPSEDGHSLTAPQQPTGDLVRITINRTEYKVPRAVMLYINSMKQKIENQRQRINQLEERLARYEQ